MIEFGWFVSHSGFQLPWKVRLDTLSDEEVEATARLIEWKFAFSRVYGVPRGGTRLAEALSSKTTVGYPTLIVDDVLTTGRSMIEAREKLGDPHAVGVVVVARGPCPNWVWPIFTVNDWAQSRATGLG